ncbi:MAG: YkgJ family cysteine cluster protein [Desulfobacteraceae bacterium]|nr:YkgJ family cysteine cluster protein [Desulfobacteraceae bacterium]
MNTENNNNNDNPSAILPVQMGYNSRFKFNCHKGVKCFTKCCRGIDIMLTPYDILTMRKRLELSSEEFLAIFTELRLLEKGDLPIVTMKLLDDEQRSCPFVRDEQGCIIYEDRPTTCRYYPLGVGSLSYASEQDNADEFFFTVKEDHCLGFDEDKEWTVAEWREDQGVDLRDQVNAGWTDLIVRKKSVPQSIKLSEQTKQMFFLACYNIDKFRTFVFESTFLEKYAVDDARVEEIRNDDVKLLQFGFEWMKGVMFGEGDIKPKNAVDASQEGQEA